MGIRKLMGFGCMALFAAGASMYGVRSEAGNGPPRSDVRGAARDFVVHEWGTFTAFEGADGVAMEGLQHETEPLPGFVHARLESSTSPFALYGDRSRDPGVRGVHSKMETPVIYFHTAK